ncbi:DNA-processing protein DprA [Nannocystis sp. bb15-2]|uniref:DNA-processing protein DprA n=1 Tax=Nannocystis bainbridge TaxID=2995303 RepID=A0ABT5E440_9BACT|nr:DNA-processing protein DprA [Nannocystis bainbridge]
MQKKAPSQRPLLVFTPRPVPPVDLGLASAGPYFLAGELPPAPRLAIVGSRAARRDRLALLEPTIAAMRAAGLALVSGGAIGVDIAAHRAALAAGVPQLAVLPCGADRPYPSQHVPWYRSIAGAAGSGLLFCHPPGTEFCRPMFASRNAVVVELAAAVLVVEAAARSGSHGTGLCALKRKRRLAVVLGSPGCADLVARGATGLPGEPDAFAPAFTRWLAGEAASVRRFPPELAWLDAALAAAGPHGLGLDAIPDPLTRLVDLLTAQRLGLVVESPPGRYRRVG